MRKFVIGDIHGAYKALKQCLQRAAFDYSADMLVCLGDVCDGYPEVPQCLDELLKIKNLVMVLGNHDLWFLQWARHGSIPDSWLHQGGSQTIASYNGTPYGPHVQLLENAGFYYQENGLVFVHGGLEPGIALNQQDEHTLVWDRSLVMEACSQNLLKESISGYQRVFVGHTPTLRFKSSLPLRFCEVVLMDTGAGWGQKLSMMEYQSGQLFQSDPAYDLYGFVR